MDRYLVVSSDGHAGLPPEKYREYLDPQYRAEFDERIVKEIAAREQHEKNFLLDDFNNKWRADAGEGMEGAWDSTIRSRILDEDGVAAEVLYPDGITERNAPPFGADIGLRPVLKDAHLQWAGARAHNRWMAEFCQMDPVRRIGLAIIPALYDMEENLKEIRWAKENGLKGVVLPTLMEGFDFYNHPKYHRMWAMLQEFNMPVNFHSGAAPAYDTTQPGWIGIYLSEYAFFLTRPMSALIFGGVFEQFPKLKVTFTEAGGEFWFPWMLELMDVRASVIEIAGVKSKIVLAQFRPAMGMNPDTIRRYEANRLRVVRQVRYSTANENCLDLVLYLNGIPVATAELKTDFTQAIGDAIDQYRYDRNPSPKGGKSETLLGFPGGALVHFAVSNSEVAMTTRLAGKPTRFLPFNKGDLGGKGNPLNPNGHRTDYLWEEVWQRDSWLEILGRYLVTKRDAKKQITSVIFPRYHQLDATRKLASQVLAEGAGGRFLIQHSAGSGKTNSIAWSAHFLSELHDAEDNKLFSSVIVVSDRNVIDTQLQEALFDFQRVTGVVETIKNDSGSKSGQLAKALAAGKKVIVCTIQTFPFALEEVSKLAATEGKAFAVIADEAHSSQTGQAATKLKEILSAEEIAACLWSARPVGAIPDRREQGCAG